MFVRMLNKKLKSGLNTELFGILSLFFYLLGNSIFAYFSLLKLKKPRNLGLKNFSYLKYFMKIYENIN